MTGWRHGGVCVLIAEGGCSKSELFPYNHREATKQTLKHILGSQGVHKSFSTLMAAGREMTAHSVSRMPLRYLFTGFHVEIGLCSCCLKFVKWHLFHKQLNIPRCRFLWWLAVCLCPSCGTRCFFSVRAWLLWTGLKGGFAAVARVVVAIILVPLTAVRASRVTEPQPHHTHHISIQTCTQIRGALGVIVGLALYHIMVFFPLCLVECSISLLFLDTTVVLKYLLFMTKASEHWAVSPPSYLPKFLNTLCWSASQWSALRVDDTWKKELVKTIALNWLKSFSMRIRTKLTMSLTGSCFLWGLA